MPPPPSRSTNAPGGLRWLPQQPWASARPRPGGRPGGETRHFRPTGAPRTSGRASACRTCPSSPDLARCAAGPDERSRRVPIGADFLRRVTENRTSTASEGRTSTRSSPPHTGPRPARAARRGSRRPPQSFDSRSTHSWGQVCGHLGSGGGRSTSGRGFPPVVHRTRRSVPGSGDARRPPSTAVPRAPPARTPVLHSAHRTYCHCCCFSLGEELQDQGWGPSDTSGAAQGRSVGPPCQALP